MSPRIGGATTVVATAWALNLLLLFAYVRPLYRPVLLDERAYRDAIRRELDRGDLLRASSIAELAADLFPRSQDFAELAPALLLQERQNPYFFKLMRDFLERRLDAGHMLSSRGEIVAIAHFLRERAWRDADRRRLLETADVLAQRRDQVPNAALLRLALVTHPSEELAALALLARVGLTKVEQEIPGRARIESFSVYEFPDGRSQILVCFRPEFPRRPRQLWLHAYPEGSRAYVDVAPIPRGYQAWDTGQLSWEIFELPDAARYNVYVGVMMDGDLGPAVHLGWFGRDGAKQASGR